MRRLAGDGRISRGTRTGEAFRELGTERRSRRACEFACTSEGFDEGRNVHGRASASRRDLPELPGTSHALARRMARRPNRQGRRPRRDRGTRLCPTIRRSSRPTIRRYRPAEPGGPYGSRNRCTSRFEATRRTAFTHHARGRLVQDLHIARLPLDPRTAPQDHDRGEIRGGSASLGWTGNQSRPRIERRPSAVRALARPYRRCP